MLQLMVIFCQMLKSHWSYYKKGKIALNLMVWLTMVIWMMILTQHWKKKLTGKSDDCVNPLFSDVHEHLGWVYISCQIFWFCFKMNFLESSDIFHCWCSNITEFYCMICITSISRQYQENRNCMVNMAIFLIGLQLIYPGSWFGNMINWRWLCSFAYSIHSMY